MHTNNYPEAAKTRKRGRNDQTRLACSFETQAAVNRIASAFGVSRQEAVKIAASTLLKIIDNDHVLLDYAAYRFINLPMNLAGGILRVNEMSQTEVRSLRSRIATHALTRANIHSLT